MNDMIFALITPDAMPQMSHHKQAIQQLREMTIAWSRYGYHGAFIEGNSIDQVLKEAASTPYRYCLIQSAGHVIDEQWYLPHWKEKGFYQSLEHLMTQTDFLVTAQWHHSENGCTGLKTDCLLVDLKHFKALGQPNFGNANGQVYEMYQTAPSQHNKDCLTTVNAKQSIIANCSGWNFIQQSLKHKLAINNFTDDFNRCRFNLADDTGRNRFTQLIGTFVNDVAVTKRLSADQHMFFNNIKKQLKHAQNGAFLFNIEPYHDLIKQQNTPKIDALFSVAAGFKPYRILHTQGYNDNTTVVFFDYSQKALDIKRYMIENWDGEDFVGFAKKLFVHYPQGEVFYQLWFGVTPDTLDWDDMQQLWQQELHKWGGQEAFIHHWQQCKNLPHLYLHCDLLKDRSALLNKIASYSSPYIWWSNAFFTIFSHWFYSAAQRKQQYLDWIEELSQTAPQCLINGADHNNIAVNGLTALQYFQQFNQQHSDELIPQALHHTDIQF